MNRFTSQLGTLFAFTFLVVLFACERKDHDYAGRPTEASGSSASINPAAIPAAVNVASVSPAAGSAPDGAALYAKHCVACHQVSGQGIPGVFPPLDSSPYVLGDNVGRLASIMLYGLIGPIHVKGTVYNSAMAPFAAQMSDDELSAVATHIRASWSNKDTAVGAEVFAAQRAKWGARGPFNISELGEEK